MSGLLFNVFIVLLLFAAFTSIANRIPKTGRCFDAAGEEITATIIKTNHTAERAATMHLRGEDGRRYRVKLKASEAKLWIKGDSVRIILSENPKKYRVLFHDYFKENETRIREYAVELLRKTVRPWSVSAHFTGYTKETPDALFASGADLQTIFTFTTYMRIVDVYSIVTAILSAVCIFWYVVIKPKFMQLMFPTLMIVMLIVILNKAVNSCKLVLKSITK